MRDLGAGSFLLGAACADPDGEQGRRRQQVVLRLDGSVVTRLTLPPDGDGIDRRSLAGPVAIGSQWMTSVGSCFHCLETTEAVNWRTGEVRPSVDVDAAQVLDLDGPGLATPLCAPLRRVRPYLDRAPLFLPAVVRNGWVLMEDVDGATLHRCGRAGAVRLPGGFVPGALGDGWMARVVRLAHQGPHAQLLRLADRRLFTVTGTHLPTRLAFTRGRLYVQGAVGDRPQAYAVTLPTR